jgi:putative transposase
MIGTTDVYEIKERFKAIRTRIASRTRDDRRVQRLLLSKYGKREKDRVSSILHPITRKIIEHSKQRKLGIAMERLKGIRDRYKRGNARGTSYRGRMNSWSFFEIQRRIEYKAKWNCISVTYVSARGTSRNCLCGSHVVDLKDRKVRCPSCDSIWDRDVLASKNIMARAVPQARSRR